MPEDPVHIALFEEDRIDHAAEALDRLRALGIRDKDMSVLSGVPYSDKILGRPMAWTRVPIIALAGAGVGFAASLALIFIANRQYPLVVGGFPYVAIPTVIPVTFELTMLGLLISTFLGVFVEMISPTYGPKAYHPKISDGYIGIVFTCPPKLDQPMHAALTELGAELVHQSEVQP